MSWLALGAPRWRLARQSPQPPDARDAIPTSSALRARADYSRTLR